MVVRLFTVAAVLVLAAAACTTDPSAGRPGSDVADGSGDSGQTGMIFIQVEANPHDPSTPTIGFPFTSARLGDFSISTTAGSGMREFQKPLGKYKITEQVSQLGPGWSFDHAECGDSTVSGYSVTVELSFPDQQIWCTFFNKWKSSS